uniref:Non-structural maintenance of chromosomes element 4 n=1 Tax=Prasinoderma coloniale TaxID=156133 RepID=A0A7R9Y1A4_9VIRI|eukprot:PRCOL_00006383-RA
MSAPEGMDPLREKFLLSQDNRRNIRNKYRNLDRAAAANKDQLTQLGTSELVEMIQEANDINNDVVHLREQATDSRVILKLSEYAYDIVKKLKPGAATANPRDVLAGLKRKHARGYDGSDAEIAAGAFDWVGLGATMTKYFRVAPSQGCMMGPLDVEPKAKKQRQAARYGRGELAELATADEVTEHKEGPTDTDRNMTIMRKAHKAFLREEARQPTLPLAINNSSSFAQTVENMFALSFLVRDGHMGLHDGDSDEICVHKHAKPTEDNWARGEAKSTQFAVSFDMKTWRAMQAAASEGNALMPHREPADIAQNARLIADDE